MTMIVAETEQVNGKTGPQRCLILANTHAGAISRQEFYHALPERVMARFRRRRRTPPSAPSLPQTLLTLAELAGQMGLEANVEAAPLPEEMPDLIRKAEAEGFDTIVAAGGDGTVRTVAQAMVHSRLRLGILPMGTANNVAHSLNIPFTLPEAMGVLAHGVERSIDVGWINNEYFLEGAGVGLFADALQAFGTEEARILQVRRLASVLIPLFWNLRARTLRLTLDGVEVQDESTLVIVANGRFIGEGLALASDADLEDGLFDIVTVGALSRMELLRFAWELLHGRHLRLPQVRRARASTVEIRRIHRSHRPLPVHADDHIAAYTPVRIDTLPGALRV